MGTNSMIFFSSAFLPELVGPGASYGGHYGSANKLGRGPQVGGSRPKAASLTTGEFGSKANDTKFLNYPLETLTASDLVSGWPPGIYLMNCAVPGQTARPIG